MHTGLFHYIIMQGKFFYMFSSSPIFSYVVELMRHHNCLCSIRINSLENNFLKSTHCEPPRKAANSKYSIAIHSISIWDYVTTAPAFDWANSSPGSKLFLWFLKKITSCSIIAFSPFWPEQTFVFEMCLIRSFLVNLCPNMIYFDVWDFSEGPSEKMTNLIWLWLRWFEI